MLKLRTADLINSVSQLGTQRAYDYYTRRAKIRITEITEPEGPIRFVRWTGQQSEAKAAPGGISIHQLATVASVFSGKPNYPIHFDRLFGGGGNSRSALETLLAYTPHFFICYPQKTNPYTGNIEKKLNHLMWCPSKEHRLGEIGVAHYDKVISEVELSEDLTDLGVRSEIFNEAFKIIKARKIHAQIQTALVEIGNAMNFRTWVGESYRYISARNSKSGKLKGMIQSLDKIPILYESSIRQAASYIDCIWFSKDFKYVPAVIQIESGINVTSCFTQMLKFMNTIPSLITKFTVVAPDDLRNKVISEARNDAFRSLQARFMSYSDVQQLGEWIKQYSLFNVAEQNSIEQFMERI